MNGVTPAPPAIKTPSPLYSIAPHASPISNSAPGSIFFNLWVKPWDYQTILL